MSNQAFPLSAHRGKDHPYNTPTFLPLHCPAPAPALDKLTLTLASSPSRPLRTSNILCSSSASRGTVVMTRQTVPVHHTPLWNARPMELMEAYRSTSRAYSRRSSTAESESDCPRHQYTSSSCGSHPDDSSQDGFSEFYHVQDVAETCQPETKSGPGASRCHSLNLFENVAVNDISDYIWLIDYLGMTDQERVLLDCYLHEQQIPGHSNEKRYTEMLSASTPTHEVLSEHEIHELSQWMWSTWDDTITPPYLV